MPDSTSLLYRPNFGEIKTAKSIDMTNRRKLRLLQVRRISRNFSSETRYLYQRKKSLYLKGEALKLQMDQLHNKVSLLRSKQNAFDCILDVIGDGHKTASTSVSSVFNHEKCSSTSKNVTVMRFRKALYQLLENRAESMKETESRRLFKVTAYVTERRRAQQIASLPSNPPDPLEAHFGSKSGTCPLCPSNKSGPHLVTTTKDPQLSEETMEMDKPEVVGVAAASEVLDGNAAVGQAIDSATVGDAFDTAFIRNHQSEETFRGKMCQAIEADLKAQLRGQIAPKISVFQRFSISAVEDNSIIQEDLDTSPPNEVHPEENVCPVNEIALLSPGKRADLPPLLEFWKTRPLSRLKTRPSTTHISITSRCQDIDLGGSNGSIRSGISEVNHYSNSSSPEVVSSYERLKMQIDSEIGIIEEEIAHLRRSCRLDSVSNHLSNEKEVMNLSLFCNVNHIQSASFPSSSIHGPKHRDIGMLNLEQDLTDNGAAKTNGTMEPCLSDSVGMCTLSQRAHSKSKEVDFDEVAIGTIGVKEEAIKKFKAYRSPMKGNPDNPATVVSRLTLGKKSIRMSAWLRRRAQELIQRQTEHAGLLENSEQLAGGDGASYLTPQELPEVCSESSKPSAKPDVITSLRLDSLKVNSCQSWPHHEKYALNVEKASSLSCPLPSSQLSMSSTSVSDIDSALITTSHTTISPSKAFLNMEEAYHSPPQNPVVFEQSALDCHVEDSLSATADVTMRKHKLLQYYLKILLGSRKSLESSESKRVLRGSILCLNQSNNNYVSLASSSRRGNSSGLAYLHEPKECTNLIPEEDFSSLSSSNMHEYRSSSKPASWSGIFAYGKTMGQFKKLPCEGHPSTCDLELSSLSSQSLKMGIEVNKSTVSDGILTQEYAEIAPVTRSFKTATAVSHTVVTASQPTSPPSLIQAKQADESVTENEHDVKATSRPWHHGLSVNSSTSFQHSRASNSPFVLDDDTSTLSSSFNLLPSINRRRTRVVKGNNYNRSMTDESHYSQVSMNGPTRVDSTHNSYSQFSNQFSSLSSASVMVITPGDASESLEAVSTICSSGNGFSSPDTFSVISASSILSPNTVDQISLLKSSNSAPPSNSMKRKIFRSKAMKKASLDAQANSGSTLSRLQTNSASLNSSPSSFGRKSSILSRFNKQYLSKSLTMVNASENSGQATDDPVSIPIFYSTTNYCNTTDIEALSRSGKYFVTKDQSFLNEEESNTAQLNLSQQSPRQIWFKEQKYNLHIMSTESENSANVKGNSSNSSPHSDSTPNSSSRHSNHFTSLSSCSSVKKPAFHEDAIGMRSSKDGPAPSQTTSAFGSELSEYGIAKFCPSQPSVTNYFQFTESNVSFVNGLSVVKETHSNPYAVSKVSDMSAPSPNVSRSHQTPSVALEVYLCGVSRDLISDSSPLVDPDDIWTPKIKAMIAPLDNSPRKQVCLSSLTQTAKPANTSSRPLNHFSNLSSTSLATPLDYDRELSDQPLRSSEDPFLSADFVALRRNGLPAEGVSPLNPAKPNFQHLASQIKSEEVELDKASLEVLMDSGSTFSRLQSNTVSLNPSSSSNEKLIAVADFNERSPIACATSQSLNRSTGCTIEEFGLSAVEEDIANPTNGNILRSVEDSSNFSKTAAQDHLWFQKIKFRLKNLGTDLKDSPNTLEEYCSSIQTDSTPNTSSNPTNHFSSLSSASPSIASGHGSALGTGDQPFRIAIPTARDCPNTKALVALFNELIPEGITPLSSLKLSPLQESSKSQLSNSVPLTSSFGGSEVIRSKCPPAIENNRSDSVEAMKSHNKDSLTRGFVKSFEENISESRSWLDFYSHSPASSCLHDGLAINTIICRVDPTKMQYVEDARILQRLGSGHKYNPTPHLVNTHVNTNASNNVKRVRACDCSKRSLYEHECDEHRVPSASVSCTSLSTFLRGGHTCGRVATCQGQRLTSRRFHMTNDPTSGSAKLQQYAHTNMYGKQTPCEPEWHFQSGQDNTISSRPFDPTSSDTFCGVTRNQTYFDDLSGGIYVRDPYVCRSRSADNVLHCHCTSNAKVENSPRARTGVGWNPNVPYASPEEIYCHPRQCKCVWVENDLFSWPMTSRANPDGKNGTEIIPIYIKTNPKEGANMGTTPTRTLQGGVFAEPPGNPRLLASKPAPQRELSKSEPLIQAQVDVNAASHAMKYHSANICDAENEVFTASERMEPLTVDSVSPVHLKGSMSGLGRPIGSDYAVPVNSSPDIKCTDGSLEPLDKQGENVLPVAKCRKEDLNVSRHFANLFGLRKDLKHPSDTATDFTETFGSKSPTITQENASKARSPETSCGNSKEHSPTSKLLDPVSTDEDLKSHSVARSLGVKAVVELPQSSSKFGIGHCTSLVEIRATIGVAKPHPANASKEESTGLKLIEMKPEIGASIQSPSTPFRIKSSADRAPVDQAKAITSVSGKEHYDSVMEFSEKRRLKKFHGEENSTNELALALNESLNPDFKIGEASSKKEELKGIPAEGSSRPAPALDESSIPDFKGGEASMRNIVPLGIKQSPESTKNPSKEEGFEGVAGETGSMASLALDEPSVSAFKIGGASVKKSLPGGKKTTPKKMPGIKNASKHKPPREPNSDKEKEDIQRVPAGENGQELPQFLISNTAANVARMVKVKEDLEKTGMQSAQEVEVVERNVVKTESDDSSSEQTSEGLFGLSLKSWKQKSKTTSLMRPLTPQHRFKKAAPHSPKKGKPGQHQQEASRERDSIPDDSSTLERRWRPKKVIEMEERISSNFPFGRFQIRTPERKRSKSKNSALKRRKKPSRSPTEKPS